MPASQVIQAHWIAVDWGTSNVRAWAMAPDGAVLGTANSSDGMGKLEPHHFESALLALVEPWLTPHRITPVLACGMVGAKQGWIDAGYRPVPCGPSGGTPIKAPTKDSRLAVWIIGGISQADPHDVMRGEETQIAGLISSHPDFEGVVCLPGTHTKWSRASAGTVHAFTTVMTGELFALLSTRSILRHSIAEGWDEPAFLDALHRGLDEPGGLAAQLFTVRAAGLLTGANGARARAQISGLLIGHELATTRHLWSDSTVAIIGTGTLAGLYARALAHAGAGRIIIPDGDMTLVGLRSVYQNIKDAQ